MQMFASLNIVITAQGIVLFTLKNREYYIIMFYQETYEVIEDAISEALMPASLLSTLSDAFGKCSLPG